MGGLAAKQGYDMLCRRGPFRAVSSRQFADLLRDLGAANLITQSHDGTLVLDLEGERLVNHYDFYAAFSTPEEYRLIADGNQLGSLPIVAPLFEGCYLIFGGRRWKVIRVDSEDNVVELTPSEGGRPPVFGGMGAMVRGEVRQAMRQVYASGEEPRFVDPRGLKLLEEGRRAFREMGLRDRQIIPAGRDALWVPWVGDCALNAIEIALRERGLDVETSGLIIKVNDTAVGDLKAVVQQLRAEGFGNPIRLATRVRNKQVEKHHVYLREELLAADYTSLFFNLEDAQAALEGSD